jgi:DNA-binding transcriptional LysR family regulator
VFRRLNQLEARLGLRAFEREGGRYHTTAEGEELVRAGIAMAETAEQALRKVAGRDLRPSGAVHISTTDSVALSLLPGIAAQCRARYPQITLSVSVDNHAANLSKRDADIAIRPTPQPPDYLIGKRIAPLEFCVYAARHYLAAHPGWAANEHEWIALDDSYNGHRTLRWLEKVRPLDQVGYRSSSFGMVRQACVAGLGLAMLPCLLGDGCDGLERVGDPVVECGTDLWLLIHPDLRHTVRIKAVFELLHEALVTAMRPGTAARRPLSPV